AVLIDLDMAGVEGDMDIVVRDIASLAHEKVDLALAVARLDDPEPPRVRHLDDLDRNAGPGEVHEFRPHPELELAAIATIVLGIHGLDDRAGEHRLALHYLAGQHIHAGR